MSGTQAGFDPDALIARIERQAEEAQERAERAQAFATEVGALRGDARSERGEVGATVDVSGRLLALDLTEAATRLAPEELSALILRTAGDAHRRASRAALARTEAEYGADSATTAQMRGELESRVGSLDDEPDDDRPGIRW